MLVNGVPEDSWFMISGSIGEKGVTAVVWDLPTPLSLQTLQTGSQDKVYTSLSCCASQHPCINESSLHCLLLQDRLQITAASWACMLCSPAVLTQFWVWQLPVEWSNILSHLNGSSCCSLGLKDLVESDLDSTP